jgi:7-cyano-7-deazaguanine synthase
MYGFVLLSGGIDSATCLAIAKQECTNIRAVSIDYGQRHSKEMEYAGRITDYYECDHVILNVENALGHSMLTSDEIIPDITYDEIKGVSPTYVPFRNGFMLARLTAYVENIIGRDASEDSACIYIGTHAEDAKNWAYPDCTPEFIGAMANAIYVGSYRRIRLKAPLNYLSKAEIVSRGLNMQVPYELTWSCYAGGEKHCGKCPTCYARKQAFAKLNYPDPTEYEV